VALDVHFRRAEACCVENGSKNSNVPGQCICSIALFAANAE
jgi:hypothetical protein